jgi:hypothetical protein
VPKYRIKQVMETHFHESVYRFVPSPDPEKSPHLVMVGAVTS